MAGGTTAVVACVVPDRGESLVEAYAKWRGWGDDRACCDYALRAAVRAEGPELSEDVRRDMEELAGPDFGVNAFFFDMAPRHERRVKTVYRFWSSFSSFKAPPLFYVISGSPRPPCCPASGSAPDWAASPR